MRIGELARLSGVPASTIRFYEQKGILPAAARKASGYRVYDAESLNRLQLIKFGQSLGFSLDELPSLVDDEGGWDHDRVMERLLIKQQEVNALLEQVGQKRDQINHLIRELNRNWDSGQCMPQQELAEIINGAYH